MTGERAEYEELINGCLHRMGVEPNQVSRANPIGAGGSGADVLELCIGPEKFILKFTAMSSDGDLVLNARRERRFYELIVPEISIEAPEILASFDDGTYGIGILMKSYDRTQHPSSWDYDLIVKAINQISLLHVPFWDNVADANRILGLQPHQVKFEHREGEIEKSIDAWKHVYSTQMPQNTPPFDTLQSFLTELELLERFHNVIPKTLVHGDFHMENCLLGHDGSLVIADWQSPQVGTGTEEVGYFLARAELYGNPLSSQKVIDVYMDSLANQIDQLPQRVIMEQSIHAKRLFVHLFWSPRYVLYYPEHVLRAVQEAIIDSAQRLQLIP